MTLNVRTLWVVAMVLLSLALTSVDSQASESIVPSGVWTGTYNVGEQRGFVRVDFAASLKGNQPGMPDIVRLVRTDLVNIGVDGSQLRFELPHASGTLEFEGTREDDVIRGNVVGTGGRGSFVLHREVPMELADYVPLLGSYRMHVQSGDSPDGDGAETERRHDDPVGVQSSRTILVMNGAPERSRPGYFEHDRFVSMFPVANDTFMSELGEWLRFDPASADEALRMQTHDGNVYVGVYNDEYREEQVQFPNGDVSLAGSLLVPAGDGPFPAVIIIHGSQGDDRHPYRYYADDFARQGIAALIYDKRGTAIPPAIGAPPESIR